MGHLAVRLREIYEFSENDIDTACNSPEMKASLLSAGNSPKHDLTELVSALVSIWLNWSNGIKRPYERDSEGIRDICLM
jgi:hypothetical protein